MDCVGIGTGASAVSSPVSLAGVRTIDIDIRNRPQLQSLLAAELPDYVFHLAAISHIPTSRAQPELAFEVNVNGTFNLLESLRLLARPVRVVFVSTGNLYGNVDSGETGFSEESPVHPTSPYAATKLIGELLAKSYVGDFGLDVMIARPFNHTGPGQAPSFACPEFARAIAAGVVHHRPVHIRTGRLKPKRDISDVRDVVRAYALLAERGRPGEIYNVCTGSIVSMQGILDQLAALGHVDVTTEPDPAKIRPREIDRLGGDCSKIRGELGWAPQIPLSQTLEDLLHYWIQRENTPILPQSSL
jgi:GDP-4-dehydro-6-deoxy-D-mannose reductase